MLAAGAAGHAGGPDDGAAERVGSPRTSGSAVSEVVRAMGGKGWLSAPDDGTSVLWEIQGVTRRSLRG